MRRNNGFRAKGKRKGEKKDKAFRLRLDGRQTLSFVTYLVTGICWEK